MSNLSSLMYMKPNGTLQNSAPCSTSGARVSRSGGSNTWWWFGLKFTGRLRGVVATMLLVATSACSLPQAQPDLTRYYLLNEVTHDAAVTEVVGKPPRIVLRPVIVPDYLRGRIMQVRMGGNELKFIDLARWAEPLEAGLTRVLREDLAQRPSRVRVVARGGDEHEFDVAVNLRRCEGVLPAGVARLAARIEIFSTGMDAELVAQDDFSFDVGGWDGADYGDLAHKLSQATDALAERIVTLIPAAKS